MVDTMFVQLPKKVRVAILKKGVKAEQSPLLSPRSLRKLRSPDSLSAKSRTSSRSHGNSARKAAEETIEKKLLK